MSPGNAVKYVFAFAALLAAPVTVRGQHNPYEYYLNNSSAPEGYFPGSPEGDEIFYVPLEGGVDIFTGISEFNFSAVRYNRRGYAEALRKTYFGNIDISSPLTTSSDYSLYSNMRRLRLTERRTAGNSLSESHVGLTGGVRRFLTDAQAVSPAHTISIFGSDRRGRLGGRLASGGQLSPKLDYAVTLYGR